MSKTLEKCRMVASRCDQGVYTFKFVGQVGSSDYPGEVIIADSLVPNFSAEVQAALEAAMDAAYAEAEAAYKASKGIA